MSGCNLRSFFQQDGVSLDKSKDKSDDINIAVVALLVSVSVSNCYISKEELDVLIEQVSNTFRLEKEECAGLINLVLPLSLADKKMAEFLTTLNQKFNTDQKQMVMAMIWRLIEADGTTEKSETAIARDIRNRLNLSFEQAVRARQIAELEEDDFEKLKIKLTESAPLDPKTLR